MKTQILFIACLILMFICCEKDSKDSNSSGTLLTITVYNAENWTVSNPNPLCAQATVSLTNSSGTVSDITNAEGKVVFNGLEAGPYDVIVTKNELSNLIEKEAGTGSGYITSGIFQSMEEVSNYTNDFGDMLQPDAEAGDLILVDVNADGVLNADDKVLAHSYSFVPYKDYNGDGVINEQDRIDGSYNYLDNVNKAIFIGR